MPATPNTLDALKASFGDLAPSEFRGQTRIVASKDKLLDVMSLLKQRGFDLLVDVTGVDYLQFRAAKDRFGLAYLLANTETNERITVRVYLNEPDLSVPSLFDLWNGADWLEREVFDMFGVVFDGHPDLRRILMPAEFAAFPLRKDYPMQGRGERHNFPVLTRREA
ncbi:MAG: NADH-quinone oxidoreductase subunit C [Pirellulaceae bacterium]|nr:NADH-quinone oxidoreductase subunit C [Pirellulaceae bacterium]